MQFATFSDFLHMGGYAACVWSAYGIAMAVLIGNLWQSFSEQRKLRKQLQRQQKYETN